MTRSPKAPGPKKPNVTSPQAKRRQRSAKAAVRRDTMLIRVESRVAPPRYTERRRAKPGAGIKHSRAGMSAKPR
jgi:hypothetical protein